MTKRLTLSRQNSLVGLFLQGATDHYGTWLFRACSYKSSEENSLEFLEPRIRKMVSRPLPINVQEDAALITRQVWKHRQMCSIRGGHVVHQPHLNDEEKMKQQRQMTCSKSHSLIQTRDVCGTKAPSSSWVLCFLPLTTVPHTTVSASVMIMTNLNKIKPRDKSHGNQDSISETEVSQLTGRKKTIQCQFILNTIF